MVDVRQRFAGRGWQPAGKIFAVDGTSYPGAPAPPAILLSNGEGAYSGFASGVVGGCCNVADGLWLSECIGYPALTLPMWPSVQTGRANLVAALSQWAAWCMATYGRILPIILAGYSQGSMVTDQVWLLDILSPTGVLHYLLPYVYRSYQFGHIFRSPGIAWGNALAGLSQSIIQDGVETGGIGLELDLTAEQTNYPAPDGKPVVVSCANAGDIYTCCSTGLNPWTAPAPEGKVGRIFMKIVMQPTFTDVVETAEVLMEPIKAIEELFHVMQFFAEGTSAPHYNYWTQMDACIEDAVTLGLSLPHYV
jgi:hypothetical protein